MTSDTIFALSSAPGRAALSVVRLSGPAAGEALQAMTGRRLPEPRRGVLSRVRDPESDETLDYALVLWFPGPKSETGEDIAELQLHGAPSVVAAVLQALGRLPGLRPAEAGEFTRRAFLNGRMDLTAVEGLADLIAAETALQRRQALLQAGGALARRAAEWRARLLRQLAELEAVIDFPEEDLPPEAAAALGEESAAVAREMEVAVAGAARGERLRQGLRVVLLGPPNAGKSTLLNALAGRDAAIVAETPGTTRDVLEVALDLGGVPVTLVDTAGLRAAAADAVEAEGMRRSRLQAEAGDILLWLEDGSAPPEREAAGLLPEAGVLTGAGGSALLRVATKADRPDFMDRPVDLIISVRTGRGLSDLESRLRSLAEGLLWSGAGAAPLVTRERQRAAVAEAAAALRRLPTAAGPELQAEELRAALQALGRLVGRVDVEDLLEVIFRDFCIGK